MTNTNAASVAAVIACVLAELDGYDPNDLHCGLYDLRWSGGPTPEPEGDAWSMDYLPKAEKIAAALASPGAVAAEPTGWQPIETAPQDGTLVLGWNAEYGARETKSITYMPGSPGFAQGLTDRWWNWDEPKNNWALKWKPTHWMPRPQEPKE